MEILCTTDREKGREPQEKAVSFYFVLQNGQGQKNRIDLQRPHKVLSAFLAPECGIIKHTMCHPSDRTGFGRISRKI